MELLIKVAGNLERHAEALDRLADELERSSPPPAGEDSGKASEKARAGVREAVHQALALGAGRPLARPPAPRGIEAALSRR